KNADHGRWHGEGLELLKAIASDARLAGHHRLDAVRAHLLERPATLSPPSHTTGLPPVGRRAYRNGIPHDASGPAQREHPQAQIGRSHMLINRDVKVVGKKRVLATARPLHRRAPRCCGRIWKMAVGMGAAWGGLSGNA